MQNITAYIGFGANLDDPVQQVLDARRLLTQSYEVLAIENSSLYLTSPIGYNDQADFVNSVSRVELESTVTALSLLSLCQSIENQLGRQRNADNQNAPRLIDLDILLFANEVIQSENLIVPHPRLSQRMFVLEPLHELAPNLVINALGTVSEVLQTAQITKEYANQSVYRLT